MPSLKTSLVRRQHSQRPNWQELVLVASCDECGKELSVSLKECSGRDVRVACSCKNQPWLLVPDLESLWTTSWTDKIGITERVDNGRPWQELTLKCECMECGHSLSFVTTEIDPEEKSVACPRCGRRHPKPNGLIKKTVAKASNLDTDSKTWQCPRCGEAQSMVILFSHLKECERCCLIVTL